MTDGRDSFICIFHREIDADRYLNLQTCLRYYHDKLPALEIILIEEDSVKKLHDIPPWVRYKFLYNPGGFSQGWAVNYAAKLSTRPIGASVCNDSIIKLHTFEKAEEEIRTNHWGCYVPYWEFYNLDPTTTQQFRQNFLLNWNDLNLKIRYGPNPPEKAGGIIFFDRQKFLDIGGFNESFRGYGAEDDFLSFKCKMLGLYSNCKDSQWNLYHLYHPIFREHSWGNTDWLVNYNLYQEMRKFNIDQMKKHIEETKNTIGNPEKYS